MKRMTIDNSVEALLNGDVKNALVGVSGGADSMVLLKLVADSNIPDVTAVHVNYGTSEFSDKAQKLVENYCSELDIPLRTYKVSITKGNFEAKAREERLRIFHSLRDLSKNVFIGSNLDDQVETFFLKLKRGNGLRGLKAMNRISLMRDMVFFRPLLSFTKEEIVRYARDNNVPYLDDPTNVDTNIDRNFLRHEILPLFESRFPGFKKSMEKVVFSLNDAKFCLDDLAAMDLETVLETGLDGDRISIRKIVENKLAMQRIRNLLQYYLNKHSFTVSYNDLISFTNMLLKVSYDKKLELSLRNRDFVEGNNGKRYVLKQQGEYLSIVEAAPRKYNRRNQ